MLFHTIEFAILLAIVWPTYLLLRNYRTQNWLLLAASYFFYGFWDWRFCFLMLFSTSVDYFVGRRLAVTGDTRVRKQLLLLSVVTNLGLLCFFKYWNVFTSMTNGFGEWLGIGHILPELHVLLPVGISFFTLQSMAYTIDVYRGTFQPWKNFPQFALYVSFFPQLLAGPIERPKNLLASIGKPRKVTWAGVEEGVFLFTKGWMMKSVAEVFADLADPVWLNPAQCSPWELLWGMYAFTLMCYCDFMGYSEMARGLARFFGLSLMENFNVPFFAQSMKEFWRRWHISVSTWLRDYVYYPLGGSRSSKGRVLWNLTVTMFLSGLWHGANWHFSLFGLLNGAYLVAYMVAFARLGQAVRSRVGAFGRRVWALAGILLTFHCFALSTLLFRSENTGGHTPMENAAIHFKGLLQIPWTAFEAPPIGMWLIAIVLLVDTAQTFAGKSYWSERWPWPVRGIVIGVAVALALVLRSPTADEFVYFQF